MKILITGASGFIGSHTVQYLSKKENIKLFLFDNKKLPYKTKHKFYQFNITDKNKLSNYLSDIKPDLVIHYASLIDPRYIEDNPLKSYLINVGATINLIDECIINKVPNFI